MKKTITFTLNGTQIDVTADSHQSLLNLLRVSLRLTGTKEGCGEGECGACTVLVDGLAINACLYPAYEAAGKNVITIEGLTGKNNELSDIQQAFVDSGAIQCGFCTPGMVLSAKALLDTHPDPSEEDIREALSGNLCRCTGYVQIIEAVKKAANRSKDKP
jgi:carbon-monoxide dehydrogenase small subunit